MTPKIIKSEMPGLYNSWRGMRERCRSTKRADAHCYSLKGITVDAQWDDVTAFAKWALDHGYQPGLTIDRKDGDLGYTPDNCRWVDRKTQGRNVSRNRLLEFEGQTKCVGEWAEITGIRYDNIFKRVTKLGWSVARALTTPNPSHGEAA